MYVALSRKYEPSVIKYLGGFMSIKKSLRLTILLLSIFPFIIAFFATFCFFSGRLKETKQEKLLYSTIQIGSSIEYFLDHKTEQEDFYLDEPSLYHFVDKIKETTDINLILADKNLILYPNEAQYHKVIPTDLAISLLDAYALNKSTTSGIDSITYNNQKFLYSYQTLPTHNLIVFAFEEYHNLSLLPSVFLILSACFVLIILPIVLLILRHFTKVYTNPIIDLRNAIQSASSGDLTVYSHYKGKNEIGELSRNFNKMIYLIKGNYDELSAMHEKLVYKEDQLRSNYNRIEYLAYHDVLTNLPNKIAFHEHVDTILPQSSISIDKHAIFFIDIDNFKIINDTLGHEYGDILLIKTAERLQTLSDSNDCIARTGGDEFLFFKADIPSVNYVIELGQHILELFKVPLKLNDETAYISLSIGVALYPENGLESHILIKNADIAMYTSKETGKNCFTLFNHKMEELLNRNSLILEVLRGCIKSNELYLLYQPQINIKENKVVGFEALMRINSTKLGMISPSEFIPIAEESGLIFELGAWALKEACLLNKNLLDLGITPCTVSVNISPVQINHYDFFDTLSLILKETGLPAKYLELELTESALVHSIMDTATIIRKLQVIGVKIALDDFGTGYSSLNYLAKMSINTLKIDKSFIDNICGVEKELSMVHTIIRLAHHLGIQVVAEGVEHQSQLVLLKEKKCDTVQGFVFSKPLYPDDLVRILKRTAV